MMRSVLIVGGSGFVGTQLALRLRAGYKVFGTYFAHRMSIPGVTMLPMNVHNRNMVKKVVQLSKPDIILYVAGEVQQKKVQNDPVALEDIHSKGAASVMTCAEMLQPKFIYLSNSYVYDGERGNYRENEPALPNTFIGKAKNSSENFIRTKSLNASIIRCSPLLGRGNGIEHSFLDRLRMHLTQGKPIELAENEIHSFAPIEGLTEMIADFIGRPSTRQRVIHYSGLTKMSYAELGRTFARRFGFDERLIVPISTQANEEKKVIRDHSLNCSVAVELLKIKPLLLEESLDLINQKLIPAA